MKVGFLVLFSLAGAAPAVARAEPVQDAAKCMVKRDRVGTVAKVKALPFGREPVTLTPGDLGSAGSCLAKGAITASAASIRGAVAEALYRDDFREVGMAPRRPSTGFADLGIPDLYAKPSPAMPELAEYTLADCVARNSADEVDDLIKTAVGSHMESAKMARLDRYLAPCAEGQQVALHRSTWRALLAQSAYRTSARYWSGQLAPRPAAQ